MQQKLWCTLVTLICVFSLHGQSVFAPVKGAEWKYYTYSIWDVSVLLPGSFSFESIVTIKYEKDTIVNRLNAKKLTQTEIMRISTIKKEDTIVYSRPAPLFMTQRNDSVLVWSPEREAFVLSFVYNRNVGDIIKYRNGTSLPFSLKLEAISDFKFPGSSRGFTKYTSTTMMGNVLDVAKIDSVHILDRIGPINADITHVGANVVQFGRAVVYRLMCYRDSEVGELVLAPTGCNDRLVNTKIPDLAAQNYFYCIYDGATLLVRWKDEKSISDRTIEIFDITGKCIQTSRSSATEVSFPDLPKGVLVVKVTDRTKNAPLIQKVLTY